MAGTCKRHAQALLAAGDAVPDRESRRFVVTSMDQHAPVAAAVKGPAELLLRAIAGAGAGGEKPEAGTYRGPTSKPTLWI